MNLNYEYILAVLEKAVNNRTLDGTELNYLRMHKPIFDREFEQFEELNKRFTEVERKLLNNVR